MNDDEQDPRETHQQTDDADEALAGIIALLEAIWGQQAGDEMRKLFANPLRFIAEPLTMTAAIEDALRDVPSGTIDSKFTPDGMRALIPALARMHVLRTRLDSRDVAPQTVEQELRQYIAGVRRALPAATYHQAVAALCEPNMGDFSPPSMLAVVSPPPGVSFEFRARLAADAIAHIAEGQYKKLLTTALQLTYLVAGEKRNIQSEVGALLRQCQDKWTAIGGPLGVVDDRIRIIRNSEAHRQTVIDARAQTITFVNRSKAGPDQTLGPWSGHELAQFVTTLYNTVAMMFSAVHPAAWRQLHSCV